MVSPVPRSVTRIMPANMAGTVSRSNGRSRYNAPGNHRKKDRRCGEYQHQRSHNPKRQDRVYLWQHPVNRVGRCSRRRMGEIPRQPRRRQCNPNRRQAAGSRNLQQRLAVRTFHVIRVCSQQRCGNRFQAMRTNVSSHHAPRARPRRNDTISPVLRLVAATTLGLCPDLIFSGAESSFLVVNARAAGVGSHTMRCG